MALASNIQRRGGSAVYYARLAVPKNLQAVIGKKELWKSLGTREPSVARVAALPVLARWRAQFAELTQRHDPSPHDLQDAVWRHYENELTVDRLERAAMPTAATVQRAMDQLATDIGAGALPWSDDPLVQLSTAMDVMVMKDAPSLARERRAAKLSGLRKHLATGEIGPIQWAADDVIRRERLLIERGSPAYRELCQRLQRAEIQALERAEERDKGNWTGVPLDPIIAPADPTEGKKHAAPGETLAELYATYQTEQQGRVTADTWAQNASIVKMFFEFIGENSHVTAITRRSIRDWKHQLANLPIKATSIKQFEGMSFRKIIEANKTVGKPTISTRTQNRYLSAIAPFCRWLFDAEYIEQDACQRMHLNVDKKKRTVYPWSDDELKVIFSSPLFATCQGDKKEHKAGNVEVRDWRYWLPYLAAYSGARLGELAQLLTADVRQLHGVWILHVTPEGSQDKSVKTDGSARVVPLHARMIELGFLKYHAAMVKRGEAQLFPELEPDSRGHFSRTPSRFFAGYFRDIGVKVDKTRNFHSFRHSATDAFRRAGYLDEQFNMLLGHTKATTTGRYGIMPEGVLSERVKMIQAINYASIA